LATEVWSQKRGSVVVVGLRGIQAGPLDQLEAACGQEGGLDLFGDALGDLDRGSLGRQDLDMGVEHGDRLGPEGDVDDAALGDDGGGGQRAVLGGGGGGTARVETFETLQGGPPGTAGAAGRFVPEGHA